ncbi:MAG: HD domain-containing protein [Sphingobacteriales bacterium]|nr:MAG: HD domain-containing protein [Sphingobacteriales bacterium]
MQVIEHPWFQRLRAIRQMGMAYLVYPGAVHTRFQHSMGACHLMGRAMEELRRKGVSISDEDCTGARLAILLHDVGHGPFSHALEHVLADGVNHERLSQLMMQRLNEELGGTLTRAIEIFSGTHPVPFLHQLVSSQLDVDRMDYLNRDSYFTGVSEGVISYDRILQMLTVRDQELFVEQKGVQSVEKFIIARRLMYWQVYLHKTVLGAEQLVINILRRAKELAHSGTDLFGTPALRHFLYEDIHLNDFYSDPRHLDIFCRLDDSDILSAIKVWQQCDDKILSRLCQMLIARRLYKVMLTKEPVPEAFIAEKTEKVQQRYELTPEELSYFVFTGITSSSTYNMDKEHIRIALKGGHSRDLSEVDDSLLNAALAGPIVKNYICYVRL